MKVFDKLNGLFIFIGFFIYFLLIFKTYPNHGSLPGNTDTIYNLSIFKDYGNQVSAFLNNEEIGNALYPEKSMQQFAELYLGEALLFNFFDLFSNDDIYTYYLFISFLFALNGWAAYLLAKELLKKTLPSIVVGIVLSSSSFAFSQIELLNGLPYAPFCLSVLFLLKFLKSNKTKDLLLCTFATAVQFYFSNYIFTYLIVSNVFILVFLKGHLLMQKETYTKLSMGIVFGLLLLIPYGIIASWGQPVKDAYNPMDLELIKKFSFALNDFWRHLPNHRIYNLPQPEVLNETMRNVNFAFIGFSSYVLLVLSLFNKKTNRVKNIALILLCIGLVFAIGPFFGVNNAYVKTPIYPIYDFFNLHNFLRIPPRAFSLVILGSAILIGSFLSSLPSRWSRLFSIIFILVFFLENTPKSFLTHNSSILISSPKSINQFSFPNPKQSTTIAFLPSSILTNKGYNLAGISEYSREYIYSYWQTQLKVNTINGMCGFFPKSRLRNNELLKAINNDGNLDTLVSENSLDFIILVKNEHFRLTEEEEVQINYIENLLDSDIVLVNSEVTIIKINN